MKERELTCICCPLGCQITAVTENKTVVSVSGNHCPRGAKYAEAEILHPVRIVTTTVPVTGGTQPRVSVNKERNPKREDHGLYSAVKGCACRCTGRNRRCSS